VSHMLITITGVIASNKDMVSYVAGAYTIGITCVCTRSTEDTSESCLSRTKLYCLLHEALQRNMKYEIAVT
jgi:hypothetical protein